LYSCRSASGSCIFCSGGGPCIPAVVYIDCVSNILQKVQHVEFELGCTGIKLRNLLNSTSWVLMCSVWQRHHLGLRCWSGRKSLERSWQSLFVWTESPFVHCLASNGAAKAASWRTIARSSTSRFFFNW
jgi:hypothetical protein